MPKQVECDSKTGLFQLDFFVGDGLNYKGELEYNDKNKEYVNDKFDFSLPIKSNYQLTNEILQISPGLLFKLKGKIQNYFKIGIEQADLEVQF